MQRPQPTHLDQHDPAKPRGLNIREEVDREVEAYEDLANLLLLVPEDHWAEFLELTGCEPADGEARYRGVLLRRAAVTAVVAQEGF